MHPKGYRVLMAAARWKWTRQDVEAAKKLAEAAGKAKPNEADARLLVGMIAHYQGDLSAAVTHLEAAHRLQPRSFAVQHHLTLALLAGKNPLRKERGLKLAETLQGDHPKNPVAIATLGWAQFRNGNHRQAIQNLQNVANSYSRAGQPYPVNTTYYLAQLLVHLKKSKDAKKLLTKLLATAQPFVHRPQAEKLVKSIKG